MKFPVPDPFPWPVGVEIPDGTEMDRAIRALLPEPLRSQRDLKAILISSPANEPAKIQGATVGPPCAHCGTRVWVAPSSRRVGPFPAALCFVCVGIALIRAEGQA